MRSLFNLQDSFACDTPTSCVCGATCPYNYRYPFVIWFHMATSQATMPQAFSRHYPPSDFWTLGRSAMQAHPLGVANFEQNFHCQIFRVALRYSCLETLKPESSSPRSHSYLQT